MDCDFTDDWYGWRLRGRYLVAPSGQRITMTRLEGILWRDETELRRAGFASRRKAEQNKANRQRVKVVVVPLAEVTIAGRRAS